MGVGVSAYDPELDRRVAIKVLRNDNATKNDVADTNFLLARARFAVGDDRDGASSLAEQALAAYPEDDGSGKRRDRSLARSDGVKVIANPASASGDASAGARGRRT